MNKFISLLFLFLFAVPVAFAGECHKITDVDDYWMKVKSGVFVRDAACDGEIIHTLSAGQVIKVVGHIEGWRYVALDDGRNGFVWSDFLEITSAPSNPQPTPDPTPTPQEPLYDIVGHDYETAIRYLENNEIIEGYPDGSYKPNQTVNRAEFTKIIVGAKLGSNPTSSSANCFPDVRSSEWYASYVCYAKNEGIIGGYPDGSFRPANTINLAEAAKILVNTLEVEKTETESTLWYKDYIEAMQNKSYLPNSFTTLDQSVSRAQMAEMVWRIKENIQSQPFVQFDFVETPQNPSGSNALSSCADADLPSTIDMAQVRQTWLGWYNEARGMSGLHAYSYNDYLNNSATVWSEYSRDVGKMSHTRPGQTEYYDYSIITDWFADLGLAFKNNYGVTYSENIGYGTYRCSDSNCTQELIDSIRHIFDGYMAEKGTSYTAHYDSVMNGYFNEIGLGIAIDSSKQVMYITIHYGTELTSHPVEVCRN